jgi:hypothetical protein
MLPDRASMDVEDLLKIILVLIIVWIAVDIVVDVLQFAFGGLSSVVGLVIVALIIAYFLDYI